MLSVNLKKIILLILILVLSACSSFKIPKVSISDIVGSSKIDATIKTIIINDSKFGVSKGLVRSMKNVKGAKRKRNKIYIIRYESPQYLFHWKNKLEKVISEETLFNRVSRNVLVLRVDIVKITRTRTWNVATTITARYRLINPLNSSVVFDKEIISQAKATSGYLAGFDKVRDALYLSINNSIKIFIQSLRKTRF